MAGEDAAGWKRQLVWELLRTSGFKEGAAGEARE
jgi:hypothetical protein